MSLAKILDFGKKRLAFSGLDWLKTEVGAKAGLAQGAEPDLGHDGRRGRGDALQPLLFQAWHRHRR